jgi:hypothetical protein
MTGMFQNGAGIAYASPNTAAVVLSGSGSKLTIKGN